MRILATHPGKLGDSLWALPSVRVLSEYFEVPIDLRLAACIAPLRDLVARQSYVGDAVVDDLWVTQDTAPRTPRQPPTLPEGYDHVFHLGYDGWPSQRLAEQVYGQVRTDTQTAVNLDLDRPWITVPAEDVAACRDTRRHLVVGFSEEWIELKVGVLFALKKALKLAFHSDVVVDIVKPPGRTRWEEWSYRDGLYATSHGWCETAALIASADLFLGCLSSQWVLANALGVPTVVCEPSKMRWDSPGGWTESIFWRPSSKNTMVLGNDGLPSFDARAVCAAVIEKLQTLTPREA